MKLPNFIALEWWLRPGRGAIATVYCGLSLKSDDLMRTFGRSIIDGVEYQIKGVEHYLTIEQYPTSVLGLLVDRRIHADNVDLDFKEGQTVPTGAQLLTYLNDGRDTRTGTAKYLEQLLREWANRAKLQ